MRFPLQQQIYGIIRTLKGFSLVVVFTTISLYMQIRIILQILPYTIRVYMKIKLIIFMEKNNFYIYKGENYEILRKCKY